jgi:hypothetical protein
METMDSNRTKWTIGVLLVALASGCTAPKPELLLPTERDQAVYVDKWGLQAKKDVKFRIAVCVDKEDYKRHPAVGQAIEAQMAEVVSKFSFFEFVERERINELAAERLFSGNSDDASSLLQQADCLLSVRLNVGQSQFSVQVQNPYTPPPRTGKFKRDMVAEQRAREAAGTHAEPRWKLEIKPDFRLYEVDSKRVALVKSYGSSVVISAPDQAENAVIGEMRKHVMEFSRLITSRYAPTARVLETRGGGEVALVSIGANAGLEPGMQVDFFEYADHSDLVADASRQPRLVGRGRVLTDMTSDTAWIEILDYEKVHVKRGHYARVPEQRQSSRGTERRPLSLVVPQL